MVQALIEGTRTAARTTDGLQTFTVSGPASTLTPKAAVIIVTSATDGSGTIAANTKMSWGCTDGSFEGGSYLLCQDAQGTMNTERGMFDDAIVRVLTNVGGAFAAIATFSQWTTGGIEINWTKAPPVALQIHIKLWFGDRVKAMAGTVVPPAIPTPGGTAEIVTTDEDGNLFRPDHVYSVSGNANVVEGFGVTAYIGLGHAIRVDATSHEMNWRSQNNVTQGRTSIMVGTDLATWHTADRGSVTVIDGTQVSSWTSRGFEVQTTDTVSGSGPRLVYLAVDYGNNRVEVRVQVPHTSVATKDHDGYAFRPWACMSLNTIANLTWTSDNSALARSTSGAFGISFASANSEWTAQCMDEDEAATSNSNSQSDGKAMAMKDHSGGSTLFAADFDSFLADGVTYDYTSASAAGNEKFALFCLEADRSFATTENATLLRIRATGSATVQVKAVGAAPLKLLRGSGLAGPRLSSATARMQSAAATAQATASTGTLIQTAQAAGAVALAVQGAQAVVQAVQSASTGIQAGHGAGAVVVVGVGASSLPVPSETVARVLAVQAAGAVSLAVSSASPTIQAAQAASAIVVK